MANTPAFILRSGRRAAPAPSRRTRPRRVLVAAIAAFALAAGTSTARAERLDLDTLVRQFSAVAFEHEYGGAHRAGRLIKWTRPIRVQLRGLDADRYRKEVADQLKRLSKLTGLSIALQAWWEVVGTPELEVNFVIYAPKGPGLKRTACATRLHDQDYRLLRAEIYIASGDPEVRRHCIAEEITQALGLANDSALIGESIFNDRSARASLSKADALILRALYDKELRPGMTRDEALPIARAILKRLLGEPGRAQ